MRQWFLPFWVVGGVVFASAAHAFPNKYFEANCASLLSKAARVRSSAQRRDLRQLLKTEADQFEVPSKVALPNILVERMSSLLEMVPIGPNDYAHIRSLIAEIQAVENTGLYPIAAGEWRDLYGRALLKLAASNAYDFPSPLVGEIFADARGVFGLDQELRLFVLEQALGTPSHSDSTGAVMLHGWMSVFRVNMIFGKSKVRTDLEVELLEKAILQGGVARQNANAIVMYTLKHCTVEEPRFSQKQLLKLAKAADFIGDVYLLRDMFEFSEPAKLAGIDRLAREISRNDRHSLSMRARDFLVARGDDQVVAKIIADTMGREGTGARRSALKLVTHPEALSEFMGDRVAMLYMSVIKDSRSPGDIESIDWRQSGWKRHFRPWRNDLAKLLRANLDESPEFAHSIFLVAQAMGFYKLQAECLRLAIEDLEKADPTISLKVFLNFKRTLVPPQNQGALWKLATGLWEREGRFQRAVFIRSFDQWVRSDLPEEIATRLDAAYEAYNRRSNFNSQLRVKNEQYRLGRLDASRPEAPRGPDHGVSGF